MRWLSVFLVAALLLARAATAQLVQTPTPPPTVTAADAAWQVGGDPVFYAGAYYKPSGPTVFFDGNTMVRSGAYEGVPLYVDATSTTFSRVLVPIGGNLLRPYERTEGAAAGTIESGPATPSTGPGPAGPEGTTPPLVTSPPQPAVESILRPTANRGIWISYRGVRWHSAGPSVSYSADRFVRVGQYRGLPVFRDKNGPANEVYVPVVKDGPLAPFRKGG